MKSLKVLFHIPGTIYFLAIDKRTKRLCFATKTFYPINGEYLFKKVS